MRKYIFFEVQSVLLSPPAKEEIGINRKSCEKGTSISKTLDFLQKSPIWSCPVAVQDSTAALAKTTENYNAFNVNFLMCPKTCVLGTIILHITAQGLDTSGQQIKNDS